MTHPGSIALLELEGLARDRLPPAVYGYYAGGADDERTLRANREAYATFEFRRRVLVDVSTVDISVELLGQRLPHPILLAPTAFQRLAHEDGELGVARAASRCEAIYVASTLSTTTLEEIGSVATFPTWFQLYVYRDREISRSLVLRAEAAGYQALCLTVSVPVQGNRERDTRSGFHLPPGLELANFAGRPDAWVPPSSGRSGLEAFIGRQFDPTLTWDAIEWLRSTTRLPLLIKGIVDGDDARRAAKMGVDGLIVSNHGGRQLDGERATLFSLREVVDAVEGRLPVLVDGGIRRGSDVACALALGARAVLIGRPYLWGLAVEGQPGVERVIGQLQRELERTLALLGRPAISLLDRRVIQLAPGGRLGTAAERFLEEDGT